MLEGCLPVYVQAHPDGLPKRFSLLCSTGLSIERRLVLRVQSIDFFGEMVCLLFGVCWCSNSVDTLPEYHSHPTTVSFTRKLFPRSFADFFFHYQNIVNGYLISLCLLHSLTDLARSIYQITESDGYTLKCCLG